MAAFDVSKYAHSPVHAAVIDQNYAVLRRILVPLPRLEVPTEMLTESASIAEEAKADTIAAVIDRRDVPNRDTPLHLAVKLADLRATQMLMAAGVDATLQNEQGWTALQEAICNREEAIARTIVSLHYPLVRSTWFRRLPCLIGTMGRMRDFYMEITFHFESSVVPFISRVAPSDTYKIWKRGANLRADMTLDGFDGFKIQRHDRTVIFLGDGSDDGRIHPGSFFVISHKKKEVMNSVINVGCQATKEEVRKEVNEMSQSNLFRPGIDVTQAVLLPQLTWRRKEKTEMVGSWKAKVYDMHNVVVSFKSRQVPGAVEDDDFFASCIENEIVTEELDDILTEDERKQLEVALKLGSPELTNENIDGIIEHRHNCFEAKEISIKDVTNRKNGETQLEKKGWLGGWRKRDSKNEGIKKTVPPRSSLCVDEKVSDLLGDIPSRNQSRSGRNSVDVAARDNDHRRGRDIKASKSVNYDAKIQNKDATKEKEFKKGLRPTLWLSPNFPIQTKELLPLLDILANKVKAVRRLRELLTTKLPAGTFPVKLAIPVVPTVRVIVTFTKLEELAPVDEFATPQSSPTSSGPEIPGGMQSSSSSWFQWIKSHNHAGLSSASSSSRIETVPDLFAIPEDYKWHDDSFITE